MSGIIQGIESYLAKWGDSLFSSLQSKAARDLSAQEAFNLMMYLVLKREIRLVDPIRTDAKGDFISPRPGQRVKIETGIAGVSFMHALEKNKGNFGSVGAYNSRSFDPTPAFAIVLHRLAKFLSSEWGATQIVYGGVGQGSGNNPSDCHMAGTCVDFYGATTQQAIFDVRRDWFLRPVLEKNGKAFSSGDFDRWGTRTQTFFRLSVDDSTRTIQDSLARSFFADVYEFVSQQCTFGTLDIGPVEFSNGSAMKAGYTMHPDYPIHAKREGHNDHMHFQLGQAFL